VFDPSTSARVRPTPIDCRTRLLLDPYLCLGPGSEVHADTLFAIAQHSAALGVTLCVERQAWLEAARDPDVVRRRVDLSRFEPIVKLDPLAVPTERDAGVLFVPVRSETDVADLKLLGALHSRVVDLLVALDGRIHGLAAQAGLSSKVLTPADALHWLERLGGGGETVLLREIDPRCAITDAALSDLVHHECEPFDPYLRDRLAAGRGRALACFAGDEPLAIGIIEPGLTDDRIEIVSLAARESARGARVFEPIVAATLAIARRRGVAVEALLPPHDEVILRLLESLGFTRAGPEPHGRERLCRAPETLVPQRGGRTSAWVLPLDARAHDLLLPELAGAPQAQLFAVGAEARPQTLGSSLRKQIVFSSGPQQPREGDLLLVLHGRAARRPASSSLTCVARIERIRQCAQIEEVLALNAARPGYSLAEIRSRLDQGPVLVVDAILFGRLERFLPLSWLKDQGVMPSAPRVPRQLSPEAWERLNPRLLLA
jgi:GNAT superfamily N-acetyltransferase